MPIFIVATTNVQSGKVLKERITRQFPDDHYEIGRGQWLVSHNGIARTLFNQLAEGDQESIEDTVTFGLNGYYGFAAADMWEWIAAKSRGY